MTAINVNCGVSVTLTAYGLSVLRPHLEQRDIIVRASGLEPSRHAVLDTRTWEGQLWELMQIFGPAIRVGAQVPFERNEIRMSGSEPSPRVDNWEVLDLNTARLRVPGGWLYRLTRRDSETAVFVPEAAPAQATAKARDEDLDEDAQVPLRGRWERGGDGTYIGPRMNADGEAIDIILIGDDTIGIQLGDDDVNIDKDLLIDILRDAKAI